MPFKFGRKYDIQEIYSWVENGNMNDPIIITPEEYKTEFIKQLDIFFDQHEFTWNLPIQ